MGDLQCVIQLEQLGYAYDVGTLHIIDKNQLLRIWASCSNNPKTVILISSLMIERNINDKNLWESVLSKMSDFKLVSTKNSVI